MEVRSSSLQHSAARDSLHTSLVVHCRSHSFTLLSPSPALGVEQLWTTVELKANVDDETGDEDEGKDNLDLDDDPSKVLNVTALSRSKPCQLCSMKDLLLNFLYLLGEGELRTGKSMKYNLTQFRMTL